VDTGDISKPGQAMNICKYIREAKTRGAEAVVDKLVFPGKNDIVVDTDSMTKAAGINIDPKKPYVRSSEITRSRISISGLRSRGLAN
jgi:hypothetical protein